MTNPSVQRQAGPTTRPDAGLSVERAVARARDALLGRAQSDGHWCFELEADCTIPAEYVLMTHFTGEVDRELERKIARYLRDRQNDDGGWPLYYGGEIDVSASVKSYWALKLIGEDVASDVLRRARAAILERGGAARSNVFTRITLALFGQVPWTAVPFVPVELVLLPRWFPFHLGRVSYWSRTVVVPLSILTSLQARAANPTGIGVSELFVRPPDEERDWFPVRNWRGRVFLGLDRIASSLRALIPDVVRRRALRRARDWIAERANDTDGLGAIFPAMVNAYEALIVLGAKPDDPARLAAREALRRLVVEREDDAYCQPCFSPVWDTALAGLALDEVQGALPTEATEAALDAAAGWLVDRQVCDGPADWRAGSDVAPGGWPFQYNNAHYPDLDDTAAVAWLLDRIAEQRPDDRHRECIDRAVDWLKALQSHSGGFAAFDANNTDLWLNDIPFADHGALLDPPTADVTARCVALLARLGRPQDREALGATMDWLLAQQEPSGAWFGRWGTNYVYGTWSVLAALELVDDERKQAAMDRAAAWLVSVQRPDGSWGESNDTYAAPEIAGQGDVGTPFQTAWAILGLLAAGAGDSPEVRRGVEWLVRHQSDDGEWHSDEFTAPGFPRVFYLRYHGYSLYFPLWALARYARVAAGKRS